MLHRISRIQLSSLFASTLRQRMTTIPQKIQKQQIIPNVSSALTQEKFSNLSINFDQQENGLINVIVAPINPHKGFKLQQVLSAVFAFGTSYSIMSTFGYIMTLGCVAGTLASLWRLNAIKIESNANRILSIKIDQQKRIHIDYISGEKLHRNTKAIVDKKNFLYNAPGPKFSQKYIWIKANNQWFVLQQQGLSINSTQIHNLL